MTPMDAAGAEISAETRASAVATSPPTVAATKAATTPIASMAGPNGVADSAPIPSSIERLTSASVTAVPSAPSIRPSSPRRAGSGLPSLDHLIGSQQHRLRDRHAERACDLLIDHELELRRLLNRQIGGLRAFQNTVHVLRRLEEGVCEYG